jgi:hypothetical protein
MNLKKIGKVFTSKFVGTGPSSYKKKKLPARSFTKVEKHCTRWMNVVIFIRTLLYLRVRASCNDRTETRVEPRPNLDVMEERSTSFPLMGKKNDFSALRFVYLFLCFLCNATCSNSLNI